MTFINWADAEEMVGLLVEYVADERSEEDRDPARREFLTGLLAGLEELSDRLTTLPLDQAIDRLQEMHSSRSRDFAGDPVMEHLRDCVEELHRIRRQTT